MRNILLINPNTHVRTTEMMVRLVQAQLPPHYRVQGVTARQGVAMITNAPELAAAQAQVLECWQRASGEGSWHGVVLACFADPALVQLRAATGVPTVGIGEAALLAASQGGTCFGIATTTPHLDAVMRAQAQALGLQPLYRGARYTEGDPQRLVAQPGALLQQLHAAVQACATVDGAQCVVIGGGPLGQAAHDLAAGSAVRLIAPLDAAAQRLCHALGVAGVTP